MTVTIKFKKDTNHTVVNNEIVHTLVRNTRNVDGLYSVYIEETKTSHYYPIRNIVSITEKE